MSNRNAPSFDLAQARALSRRLAAGGAPSPAPAAEAPSAGTAYVRFPGLAVTAAAPAPQVAGPAPEVPEPPGRPFRTWDEILRWCEEQCRTELCFVVDAQGFVMGHRGAWAFDDIEDVASQITVTMSRADQTRTTGRSRSMSIEYGDHWVVSVRISSEEAEAVSLVLVTAAPLPVAVQRWLSGELPQLTSYL